MRQARRVSPVKIAIYAVLILWALTTVYPFVWVLLNSFREKGLIRRDSFSIPLPGNGFTLEMCIRDSIFRNPSTYIYA